MVKINLKMKAHLEAIEKISSNDPDFQWFLKLKCTNCGEISDKWHDICLSETVSQKGGRGETNFACKCKMCGRENTLDILSDSLKPYTKNDDEKFKAIVTFDCRGIEPVEFSPRAGWVVEAEDSGSIFKNVDLSDDWVEYDERANRSVTIDELTFEFERVK